MNGQPRVILGCYCLYQLPWISTKYCRQGFSRVFSAYPGVFLFYPRVFPCYPRVFLLLESILRLSKSISILSESTVPLSKSILYLFSPPSRRSKQAHLPNNRIFYSFASFANIVTSIIEFRISHQYVPYGFCKRQVIISIDVNFGRSK